MNSQTKTKDSISKLQAYELQYARVVCFAAMLLYPVSGMILKILDNSSIDNMNHRLILSLLFLIILSGSFKFDHFKNMR